MTPNVLTDSAIEPLEAGKGGEGGDFLITTADFVAAVFPLLPEGAFAAACSKSGKPGLDGWSASRAAAQRSEKFIRAFSGIERELRESNRGSV